jgi:hypothetical protein
MSDTATFGPCLEGVTYADRPAAYVVVAGANETVAAMTGTFGQVLPARWRLTVRGSRRRDGAAGGP